MFLVAAGEVAGLVEVGFASDETEVVVGLVQPSNVNIITAKIGNSIKNNLFMTFTPSTRNDIFRLNLRDTV
jgi:hypothetical protein